MDLQNRNLQRKFGRRPDGMAAILLPFTESGTIDADAFQNAVARTASAGLRCAVNMDTGYANYLTEDERRAVLTWTKQTLGDNQPFVAGAFIEGEEGEIVGLYHRQMDEIANFGGTPIIFQTSRFHTMNKEELAQTYAHICAPYDAVLGFELGQMFAPFGKIYDTDTIRLLMSIHELKGIKHSSLDRGIELERLALRDAIRPDFRIYTGNDLGIDMIEFGSDYLLGLAAFCPEKFAERDTLWENGDPAYATLHDALQYLGNIAFRDPVPAYKHSCAVFQHLLGRISSPEPHPQCPRRPEWEPEILRDCAKRLGYFLP